MADFFKKITGGIDKGIKVVGSKGKELMETTRLKGEIRDDQDSIQNRFKDLGKKVFEMLNRGALNEDELKIDCGEIASLFKKITELEEAIKKAELEALKTRYGADIMICHKCGAHNKYDSKFCMSCGSVLATEVIAEGRNCPTCGTLIKKGAHFCSRCGGEVGLNKGGI